VSGQDTARPRYRADAAGHIRLATATLTRGAANEIRPAHDAGGRSDRAAAFTPAGAQQNSDSAAKVLKAMSDYMASQKATSFTFDSSIEIITPEVQKIQFASSGRMLLVRPDKLRATRTGGYTDVEFVFDGKLLSVLGKNLDAYAQAPIEGSIDQLIERLRTDYSLEFPGADLLLARPYDQLMTDVLDAKHIGQGVVNGTDCEHLGFRTHDTDWQIWVEAGANPIPRKYVITSKTVAGAPQYTLTINDWKTDVQVAADAFAFKEPAGAKKRDVGALSGLDEIPPGTVPGAKK
jgi:hypothetical protein